MPHQKRTRSKQDGRKNSAAWSVRPAALINGLFVWSDGMFCSKDSGCPLTVLLKDPATSERLSRPLLLFPDVRRGVVGRHGVGGYIAAVVCVQRFHWGLGPDSSPSQQQRRLDGTGIIPRVVLHHRLQAPRNVSKNPHKLKICLASADTCISDVYRQQHLVGTGL